MTTRQEWTAIGRFVAMLVKLFTLISKTFKKKGIGLESIEWLTGEGEKFLVEKVNEIAEESKKYAKWIVVAVAGINRSLTPQQALDATGRELYNVDSSVVPTDPAQSEHPLRVFFFFCVDPTTLLGSCN